MGSTEAQLPNYTEILAVSKMLGLQINAKHIVLLTCLAVYMKLHRAWAIYKSLDNKVHFITIDNIQFLRQVNSLSINFYQLFKRKTINELYNL